MSKKKPQEFYSTIDEIADKEAFLESVQEGFKEVEDPRAADNQGYRLVDLLIIIICAILAGANTIADIHAYGQLKMGMLQQFLQMNTAPSYDVFWWLLTRLNPRQLESCFVRWIQSLPDEDKNKLIAIDGKHLRGAARSKQIHLVSAWDSTRSLLLGQVKADEKSNEITAIPELLDNLDLTNATVLATAGNTAENLAALKRLASTMIRIDLGGVRGTAQRRRQAAWDDSWTLKLLSRIFDVNL